VSLPDTAALPLDAARVLELAAQEHLRHLRARTAMGTMVVDRSHRIVWISDGYKRFLPALGHAEHDFVGRRVEEVVPNTLMGQVIDSGQPILVDLLSNQAGTFLVSRLPLRNEAGEVIGAVALVLLDHPETTMQPLMAKFAALQGELDARAQLAQLAAQRRPRTPSPASSAAARRRWRSSARRAAWRPPTAPCCCWAKPAPARSCWRTASTPPAGARPALRRRQHRRRARHLLEAEFFGVAPGAYTGAERKGRDGKFKRGRRRHAVPRRDRRHAAGAAEQAAARAAGAGDRAAGQQPVESVDVRIIAATSRDLAAMVAEGRFRADLYYRLNVLPIRLPPLRERLADLEALVERCCRRHRPAQRLPRSVSAEALAWLASRPWPGNIRELRNVLEQATLMTDDLVLEPRHLGGAARVAAARLLKMSRAALYDRLARWPELARMHTHVV
jgi:transcriptional regulator with PAS, ATPase and Fis domain